MKENKLMDESFDLALDVVRYCNDISRVFREYILTRQLTRSGTSIGANIREAQYAVSRPDFINKLHIALKECNETEYWLELMEAAGYKTPMSDELRNRNSRIKRMLISSIRTMKDNVQ